MIFFLTALRSYSCTTIHPRVLKLHVCPGTATYPLSSSHRYASHGQMFACLPSQAPESYFGHTGRLLAPPLLLLPHIFIALFLKSFLPCMPCTLLVCNYVIVVYHSVCTHSSFTNICSYTQPPTQHQAILPEIAMLQEVYGSQRYPNTILTFKVEFAIHYSIWILLAVRPLPRSFRCPSTQQMQQRLS